MALGEERPSESTAKRSNDSWKGLQASHDDDSRNGGKTVCKTVFPTVGGVVGGGSRQKLPPGGSSGNQSPLLNVILRSRSVRYGQGVVGSYLPSRSRSHSRGWQLGIAIQPYQSTPQCERLGHRDW